MDRETLLALAPEAGLGFALPRSRRAGLLVVDGQEYFRPLLEPLLPALMPVVEAFRRRGAPLWFTRHGHESPEKDGGRLAEWWGDLILAGSAASALLPEFGVGEGDAVVPKKRYSAFFGTALEAGLRGRGVEDLVVAGVMTNLCCETTARDAFVRDFRVFFLADGTATASEELHRASLRNLAFGFAHLLTCGEAVRALS